MSVFRFPATGAQPILKKITGNTATTIVDASDGIVVVPWFEVNDNAGGTQTLTVDIYDGTTAFHPGSDAGVVYTATAVTADLSVKFTAGYVIPKGSLLRVTSGDAAGKFDVFGLVQMVR